MSRSRRTKRSNRRLPNSTYVPSPTRSSVNLPNWSAIRRSLLIDPGVQISRNQIRHLAQVAKQPQFKSHFPKTYGALVRAPLDRARYDTPKKPNNTALTPSVCVSRAIRSEVLHATNRAGKSGQKTPKWTLKSKIRCK